MFGMGVFLGVHPFCTSNCCFVFERFFFWIHPLFLYGSVCFFFGCANVFGVQGGQQQESLRTKSHIYIYIYIFIYHITLFPSTVFKILLGPMARVGPCALGRQSIEIGAFSCFVFFEGTLCGIGLKSRGADSKTCLISPRSRKSLGFGRCSCVVHIFKLDCPPCCGFPTEIVQIGSMPS